MILDAGFLISVDRGERAAQEFLAAALDRRTPLGSTHPVLAQVWRGGARQARLAKLIAAIAIYPLGDGRSVGALLARAGGSDVVDAHLVSVAAAMSEPILTGDVADISALVAALPEDRRPAIFGWP